LADRRPDAAADLHGRAAAWYREHGRPLEAVRHGLVAGDLPLLRACLVGTWFQVFAQTDVVVYADVLAKFPRRELGRAPELAAIAATIELVAGNGRAARDLIARVEESGPCADAAGQAVVTFALLLARWVDGRTADTAELAR